MAGLVSRVRVCLLIVCACLHAHAEDGLDNKLRYRLDFKDGSQMIQLMSHSEWLTDFQKSNLHQGLMVRMSGLLNALPTKTNPSWQGRLVDFLLEKALKNRPTSVKYFQAAALVSPVGFSVGDLSDSEASLLARIAESLRIAPNQSASENANSIVIPISVSTQKIAIAFSGKCMAVGRDPSVAVATARLCAVASPQKWDISASLNLVSIASSTGRALRKWTGIGQWLEIGFKKEGKSFEILEAQLPLNKVSPLRDVTLAPVIAEALPASTLILVSAGLPSPESIDVVGVKAAIKKPQGLKTSLQVAFFYLGTQKTESDTISKVGVLVPNEKKSSLSQEKLAQFFQPYYGNEVFVRSVCKDRAFVVTPTQLTLDEVEGACAKKLPSLMNGAAALANSFGSGSAVSTVFLNTGRILGTAFENGILEDVPEDPSAIEIKDTRSLLKRLPALHFVGQRNAQDYLQYKAFSGVF